MAGAHIGTQIAANLIPIDIRQHDVQHNQVRQHLLCFVQGVLAAHGNIDFKVHAAEVDLQHVANINVIFHN